jgi:hypothetical protein
MVNAITMPIIRVIFLVIALTWDGLSRLSNDPDWKSMCEDRYMGGYMLFNNIDMLPSEMLEPLQYMIVGFMVGMIGSILLQIWQMAIKGWLR